MWSDMCWVDPAPVLEQAYRPAQIPSAQNPAGRNVTRFINKDFDSLLDQGASALSLQDRAKAYRGALTILVEQKPVIYLFERAQIAAARRSKVRNWLPVKPNPWLPLAEYFQNASLVQR
jgi:ABC-type transport system substrate-binding protein